MKYHKIAIIDDQGLGTGFDRFLKLLLKNDYLRHDDFSLVQKPSYDDGLGMNEKPNSMQFRIYTHNYGDLGFQKSFSEALIDYRERCNSFDIHIYDLNFIDKSGNSFYPLHDENTCSVSESFVEGLDVVDVTESQKSTYIAGLEFYHCAPPSKSPKIIYSAADETATLRSSVKLFNSRLFDTFVVDVMAPEKVGDNDPFANSNDDIKRVFSSIDTYLRSKQIQIISRQSAKVIEGLIELVKNLNEHNIDEADIPNIPSKDLANKEYWSLRSLFPKQVNQIAQSTDIQENKKYILNILNNKFPDIVFWLLFNHGEDERGTEIDKLTQEEIQKKLNFFDQVDFDTVAKKAESYIKLSDISEVNELVNKNTSERGKHLDDLRTAVVSKYKSFEFNYQEIGFLEPKSFKGINIGNDYLKKFAQYGIYIGDLVFIKKIAEANKHHCNADTVHLNIKVDDSISEMEIEYIFNDADRFEGIRSIKGKIQSYFESERYFGKFELRQLGIEDLLEIMIKRYNAEGKIQIGKESVWLNAEALINREQKKKVSYKFILKSKNKKNEPVNH
jgi:hypothetical protein